MRRRLPYESKELLRELTEWIAWRHANSKDDLVLTSAPTSLPSPLENWMPDAVWRLAWLKSGSAILFGLAPGSRPGRYFVVRHDAISARREGIIEKDPGRTWRRTDGDSLEPQSSKMPRTIVVGPADGRYRARRRSPKRPTASAART
jgi:hypothetical protein